MRRVRGNDRPSWWGLGVIYALKGEILEECFADLVSAELQLRVQIEQVCRHRDREVIAVTPTYNNTPRAANISVGRQRTTP